MSPQDVTSSDSSDLIRRLKDHRTFRSAPLEEMEWLVRHGTHRWYEAGERIVARGEPANEMLTIFTGRIVAYFDRGSGRRDLMESKGGTVTGVLPFSRLKTATGEVISEDVSEVIAIHRDLLPAFMHECPAMTATLVHELIDRTRRFTANDYNEEKILSLGRLAGGLAHELNNPASSAARSARVLRAALDDVGSAAQELGALQLTDEQRAQIATLLDEAATPAGVGVLSPLKRAEREDSVAEWMADHGQEEGFASPLADSAVTLTALEDVVLALPAAARATTLRYLVVSCTARSLTADVERASNRVSELVASIKDFTHLGRAHTPTPTDITPGLSDTIAILSSKARARAASVRLDVEPDLPMVLARPGELNQVWINLLTNALDAVGESGEVAIRAETESDTVVVRVIDNGSGITDEVKQKMFDPFYTTKPFGEGAGGLGLDIVRRIVRLHEGQVECDSKPGRTEFLVRLPLSR